MANRFARERGGRHDEAGKHVPWLVAWHGNEIPVLQYLHDHNYVCYKEGHEHWCVGGQRAIAAGLTEFCGCQHIYAGCQAFPADPAATPPPTDED